MERDVSLGPELVAVAPVVIALLALVKRLSGFALEIRSHRAGKRRELIAQLNALNEELANAERHSLTGFDVDLADDPSLTSLARDVLEGRDVVEGQLLVEVRRANWARRRFRRAAVRRSSTRLELPVTILALLRPADAERCAPGRRAGRAAPPQRTFSVIRCLPPCSVQMILNVPFLRGIFWVRSRAHR